MFTILVEIIGIDPTNGRRIACPEMHLKGLFTDRSQAAEASEKMAKNFFKEEQDNFKKEKSSAAPEIDGYPDTSYMIFAYPRGAYEKMIIVSLKEIEDI